MAKQSSLINQYGRWLARRREGLVGTRTDSLPLLKLAAVASGQLNGDARCLCTGGRNTWHEEDLLRLVAPRSTEGSFLRRRAIFNKGIRSRDVLSASAWNEDDEDFLRRLIHSSSKDQKPQEHGGRSGSGIPSSRNPTGPLYDLSRDEVTAQRANGTPHTTAQPTGHGVGQQRWKSTTSPSLVGLDNDPYDITQQLPIEVINRRKDPLDLTFQDHHAAFKSKTTMEVLRALLVFQLCGINFLVDNNEKLMKIGQKVLGKRLFGYIMKKSFYGQFVAGEDTVRIQPTIDRMRSFGVKSILDYSVEEDLSTEEAEDVEMESCLPEEGQENDPVKEFAGIQVQVDNEFKAEMKRYQPKREFGDRRVGVTGARTFFYQGEANCERNLDIFMKCIETVHSTTHTTGFAAIKLTALGRPSLLLQLSEVIARARKYHQEVTGHKGQVISGHADPRMFENRFKEAGIKVENPEVQSWLDNMTYDKKGLIHLFSWSGLIDTQILLQDLFQVPNLKTGKMETLISALTKEEEEQFKNMLRRIHTVFEFAKQMDVRVMVDAEQTYFQPAISRLTMEMMKKYNTEKAIVFNTYQCYLRNAFTNLILDLEQANRQDFYFGAKLVRGAYMEQERERAQVLNYPDPINPNFEATSEMYHRCLEFCMRRMYEFKQQSREKVEAKENLPLINNRVGIMVASHNEDTVRFAIKLMEELDIKPEDKVICFGQLVGMCDHLSFPLGQAGYSVYKYVPYGPVSEVLPYLSRRAHENKGILTKLEKEKTLLKRELKDRVVNGRLFYKPDGDYIPI